MKSHLKESKRIYDLLNEEELPELKSRKSYYTIEDIRDYTMINLIYDNYLKRDFPKVVWEIKQYEEFEFFRDLAIYLKFKYANNSHISDVYQEFINLYYG